MIQKKQYFIKLINHKLRTFPNERQGFLQNILNCRAFVASYSSSSSTYIDVSFAEKYDFKTVEENKYEKWEKNGYFLPKHEKLRGNDEIFTMILPPPNITGTLHLGHALTITIQDILCRWKRMQGIPVLWIPGTDHAGIATHVVVEKNLFNKKGLRIHDVGQERFLHEISEWRKEKESKINDQIKRLGASLDWSRYYFTMDNKQSNIVQETLIKMFDDGLICRKNSFVNWCCHLRSTISDIEVDHVEVEGSTFFSLPGYDKPVEFGIMTEFAYKVCDSEDEICVATTRLETICGDVAVVINPDDSRYLHLHGKFVWHPFRKCKMPIILDESASPSLGTGAFKLTPGHSKIDYEIAIRHNLPVMLIINESGILNENCGEWMNVSRFVARDLILRKLQHLNLYRGTKDHKTVIPFCNRSGDVVEHMLKLQWFMKTTEISQKSLDALNNNELNTIPKNMKNVISSWLQYPQDWCLSRQIWWGHKFPFFETEHGWVAARSVEDARQKGEKKFEKTCTKIIQENDVIDTWFSSALLPFSVFGWPNSENDDYRKYYPLSLMETGRDIAQHWVARMVILGLHFTGKVPFKEAIFHGLICDANGRKMSKSLGNVIELNHVTDGISLEELHEIAHSNHKNGILSKKELQNALKIQKSLFSNGIPSCGADALRFTLVSHNIVEPVIHFDVEKCHRNTKFCNKMWQAFRFSITWANKYAIDAKTLPNPTQPWHYWLLHKAALAVETCNWGLEEMRFDEATSILRVFFIDDLCDFYLEVSKFIFHNGPQKEAEATASVLIFCLETYLRLLAPIMPYVAEELYSNIPGTFSPITETSYPKTEEYQKWKNQEVAKEIIFVRNVISSIRGLQAKIKNYTNNEVVIISSRKDILEKYTNMIENLLRCSIHFQESGVLKEPSIANTVQNHTKVYLKLKSELENISSYIELLQSKKRKLTEKLNYFKTKTSAEKYMAKAREERKKVDEVKMKELQLELEEIEELLSNFQNHEEMTTK